MVTYLVHYTVRHEIADEFTAWLQSDYIPESLKIPGFKKAELLLKKGGPMMSSSKDIKVIYTLSDEDHLKKYVAETAMPLREKALEKFPGMFSVQREVWLDTINFTL